MGVDVGVGVGVNVGVGVGVAVGTGVGVGVGLVAGVGEGDGAAVIMKLLSLVSEPLLPDLSVAVIRIRAAPVWIDAGTCQMKFLTLPLRY